MIFKKQEKRMNKEEKIFEENMDKLNRMIEDFTIEDASSYLIASGLFKDEDELFFYLNQYLLPVLHYKGFMIKNVYYMDLIKCLHFEINI